MSDVNTTVSMSEICELREAEILDGQTLTIDGTNGGIAAITCRHLREAQKAKLVSAIGSIRARLIVPNGSDSTMLRSIARSVALGLSPRITRAARVHFQRSGSAADNIIRSANSLGPSASTLRRIAP